LTDLEGLARRLLAQGVGQEDVVSHLTADILLYKPLTCEKAQELAENVLTEVATSEKVKNDPRVKDLTTYVEAGVSMNSMGVGCRGSGDLFVHRYLADLASTPVETFLNPSQQDDAGAVKGNHDVIVCSVDGVHSRLTDFPFLSGFHVTRAALRDVYVKGARPVALIVDLHLADDGDVAHLFDFMAGVRVISRLTGIPVVAGSTLRIGGDMVIGTRFVSCVAAVGVTNDAAQLAAKKNITPGDIIVCTDNAAGGGTVTVSAIYGGAPEVIEETLNIQFVRASEVLLSRALFPKIHAATDWTNGGIRLDFNTICEDLQCGIEVKETALRACVNQRVLNMLEKKEIDFLGLSLGALVLFVPPENVAEIQAALHDAGIGTQVIGRVLKEPQGLFLVRDNERQRISPHYREAAYTLVKRFVGEASPDEGYRLQERVREAAVAASEKAARIEEKIRKDMSIR
jgi:hydrogenase expression/formation protein